jgi:uncharacterized membrane protein YbhN (UPF0104 family)
MASVSWRTSLSLPAKAAGSLLVAYLIWTHVDLAAARESFAAASPPALALAFASFLVVPVLGGLRWWAALRGLGERGRLGEITAQFSVATVVAQVLPSIAGDGMRIWLAARRGRALRVAVQSVLVERVLTLLALLALALVTAPLLAARTGERAPIWLCAALLAAGAAGLGVVMLADVLPNLAAGSRLARHLRETSATTRALVLSRWGAGLAGLGVISNLNFVLAAVLLGQALGLRASALDFLAVMPVVTLATILPISLGGWGVREGALILLLGRVGVPAADALALSLAYGGFGVLCGLPGAIVWGLLGRGREPVAPPPAALTCP